MTLKKLIKKKDRIVEKYSIEASYMESCNVPDGYKDIVDVVSSKLKNYCVFNEMKQTTGSMGIIMGGPIPDHLWQTTIETEDNHKIDIIISQSYTQPLRCLSKVRAEMKYVNNISEDDLNIIREVLTSSGLEKQLEK